MANFHIIGTGLAGLAAATHIARAGHYVQLYEATSSAGGRCSLLRDEHRNDGYDGCNALLFGGNSAVRTFAEHLGSAHSFMLLDRGGSGYDAKRKVKTKRAAFLLPPALPLVDVLQLLRMRFSDASADTLFDYYHPLTESYIEPICRGVMLSDAVEADASHVAQRVWNIARSGSQALKLMVPRNSLYHSLVEPALRQIEHEGGSIYYSHALKKIAHTHGHITGLHFAKQVKELRAHDNVILALPAHVLQQLLPDAVPCRLQQRDVLAVHFHTDRRDSSRIVPLVGASVDWVRDHNGVISALSYVPAGLLTLHDESIAKRVWADVREALGEMPATPPPYRVVRSRRAHATSERLPLPARYKENGFLAGELFGPVQHVPFEAAILSGIRAAEMALHSV